MPTSPEIWVLGGSGDVGRRLAAILRVNTGRSIVLCGRNWQKADDIAREIGGRAIGRSLDVSVESAVLQIPPGSSVVNLTEATHPKIAETTIRTGGVFIESAATPSYVHLIAEAANVTGDGLVVVNAGLMPGLSTVLAHALGRNLKDVTTIDIVIEIGMRRHYGKAATLWTIKSLDRPYDVLIDGASQKIRPGFLRRNVAFEEDRASRLALGFPFSVQLDEVDSGVKAVRSFLAIDPPWMTRLVAIALRLGLGKCLSNADGRVDRFIRKLPASGHAKTRLIVEGLDCNDKPVASVQVSSGDQADMTANLLAETLLEAEKSRQCGLVETQHILKPDQALAAVEEAIPDTRVFFSSGSVIDAVLFDRSTE